MVKMIDMGFSVDETHQVRLTITSFLMLLTLCSMAVHLCIAQLIEIAAYLIENGATIDAEDEVP